MATRRDQISSRSFAEDYAKRKGLEAWDVYFRIDGKDQQWTMFGKDRETVDQYARKSIKTQWPDGRIYQNKVFVFRKNVPLDESKEDDLNAEYLRQTGRPHTKPWSTL